MSSVSDYSSPYVNYSQLENISIRSDDKENINANGKLSLKRTNEIKNDHSDVKKIKSSHIELPVDEINYIDFTEFKQIVESLRNKRSFSENLTALKNHCSLVPQSHALDKEHRQLWQLWIQITENESDSVLLQIFEKQKFHVDWYESNFISLEELTKLNQNVNDETSFVYINLLDGEEFENGRLEDPVFRLRIDPNGTTAEAVSLHQTPYLNGNEIKNLIVDLFDVLNVEKSLWNDESKISYETTADKSNHIAIDLRLSSLVVSPLIDEKSGTCGVQTWYSKSGCRLWECEDVLFANGDLRISQSKKNFYTSVYKIRNMSLAAIKKEFSKTDSLNKNRLNALIRNYLKSNPKNKNRVDFNVHELAAAIFQKVKGKKDNKAQSDFAYFYDTFLSGKITKKYPESSVLNGYKEAIDSILQHQLWIRPCNEHSCDDSYITLNNIKIN